MREDEQKIEQAVRAHRKEAHDHGREGIPGLSHGIRKHLREREGQQPEEHHEQILLRVVHGQREVALIFPVVQEEVDQRLLKQHKDRRADREDQHRQDRLEPQGIAYAVLILLAVILRGEYADAAESPEDREGENKQDLIHDGNAGHLLGAEAPHHDVIEHADQIRDEVLQHDGQGDGERGFIKRLVADEFFQKHTSDSGSLACAFLFL